MMRRPVALIIITGLLFITAPVFFERLHSDEVIFWEVAKNISIGLGPVSETIRGPSFFWHMPLAFYAVAPFLKISPHIFTARVVASFFTVGCAVLIYIISSRRYGRGALAGAMLFLFSFQALRYGGRFYLDQFGAFFFLLSLYFVFEKRYFYAGVFGLISVFTREYWAGVYPFVAAYILLTERKARPAALFILPFAALIIIFIFYASGDVKPYILNGAVANNMKAFVTGYNPADLSGRLLRAWAEFAVLNCAIVAGALITLAKDRKPLFFILPQLGLLSLVNGFIIDGGVTQYPLGFIAVLSIFSGPGINSVLEGVFKEDKAMKVFAVGVAAQFIFFNVIATSLSLHKNVSIYSFGFKYDKAVIDILRREAAGGYIHGVWGAFVEGRKNWDWTDYRVQEAIEKDPDWFITYENYVDIKDKESAGSGLEVYRIGPYVMLHTLKDAHLKDFVSQKDFSKWALRKD